ncbi:PREDICTED: uncharacterized protein LOC104736494 [Camelina sativa]|uniref:Uncharacterized protein LOC104736494 n=1 Tax=Camelina sativa TaxID=90675 RepID=A0ABM0VE48_CAMSA|nr:PREDICTED: uncharacterized protein LOC104736494 [Camelina sativa]
MESTELHDMDFKLNPFTSFSEPTFFTPTTSSLSDEPDSPKAQNEDDDEYITELTRQMTNYMLQDDEKHQKSRGGGGSGSPQSTLWSPFASGYSSPIGPSREPSPPLTPTVETIMTKVDTKPVTIPFQSKQALIDDQIRSIQANFHKIKKEKEKEKKRNEDVLRNKARNYQNQLQQQQQQRPKSGVKAVFVNGLGSRTGSGGTGVFLPRTHGNVVESRKKSGCSTVIIPARVVEALKVHFDKMGVPSTFSSDIPPFHDALLVSMKNKNNKSSSSSRPVQSGSPYVVDMPAESHQEPQADLPQEWTY